MFLNETSAFRFAFNKNFIFLTHSLPMPLAKMNLSGISLRTVIRIDPNTDFMF